MAHECENCGMYCYCDMDDCGGFEQPIDCPHLTHPDVNCYEYDDEYEGTDERPELCVYRDQMKG